MPRDKLDKYLVLHCAKIARLDITDEELEKYSIQLNVILEAFKELDEVDTSGVAPSFHPLDLSDVLRDDVVEKWEGDPLANADHKEKPYFRGPRII
jgi:aspartyl-tRNA(Asn)/glutamyl-tRNA(Gln) amidotransferase subunit C